MRRIATLFIAFAAGIAAHAGFQTAVIAREEPVKFSVVLQSPMTSGNFDEGIMHVYEFQPGAVLPWHIHADAHEFAFILDGSLTVEVEGQGERVFGRGTGSYLPPNVVHRGIADPKTGAKLVTVRLKPKDAPLVTLVPKR